MRKRISQVENKPLKSFSIRDVINNERNHNEAEKTIKKNLEQKTDYFQLLKSPQWQEMRLKVMERDGFSCWYCDSTTKTLNVHHLIYKKNAKPWEYDPDDLLTLCEDCHTRVTTNLDEIITYIKRSARSEIVLNAICNIIRSIKKIEDNIR